MKFIIFILLIYQSILVVASVLNDRVLKNETYSLRAFARDLNLNPGFLSDVLAKKANLSIKKGIEVANLLRLSIEDQKLFCKLVEIDNSKDLQTEKLKNQVYNFDSSYVTVAPRNLLIDRRVALHGLFRAYVHQRFYL